MVEYYRLSIANILKILSKSIIFQNVNFDKMAYLRPFLCKTLIRCFAVLKYKQGEPYIYAEYPKNQKS